MIRRLACLLVLSVPSGAVAQVCSTQLTAVSAASAKLQKDTETYPAGVRSPNGSVTNTRFNIVVTDTKALATAVAALSACLATPSPSPTPTPTPTPTPAGFTCQYWNTPTPGVLPTTAPTLTRTETAIAFDWGVGSPAPAISSDTFGLRCVKSETLPAGTYVFTATADDGVRVFVDGVLVIDQWRDQGATTFTATNALTAGTHEIRVDYYEHTGDAVLTVAYARQAAMTGVAWDAEPTATGYVVAYGTAPRTYATLSDVGSALTFKPSGLRAGTTYYFAVQSYTVQPDGSKLYGVFSPDVTGVP